MNIDKLNLRSNSYVYFMSILSQRFNHYDKQQRKLFRNSYLFMIAKVKVNVLPIQ